MAFIVLRRSRNTRSYYLVESYRDNQGKTRRRTICYLGREQDQTDSLEKAIAHWEKERGRTNRELRKAKGAARQVIRRRIKAIEVRTSTIAEQMKRLEKVEAKRLEIQRRAEESHQWLTFELLRRHPTAENAKAAKQAFLFLAKRHHPDTGGSHAGFLRVKDAYDKAIAVWRRHA
ncbi:hypothetical protein BH10PLA2_BH10PLA2_16310 [soil metagenome]